MIRHSRVMIACLAMPNQIKTKRCGFTARRTQAIPAEKGRSCFMNHKNNDPPSSINGGICPYCKAIWQGSHVKMTIHEIMGCRGKTLARSAADRINMMSLATSQTTIAIRHGIIPKGVTHVRVQGGFHIMIAWPTGSQPMWSRCSSYIRTGSYGLPPVAWRCPAAQYSTKSWGGRLDTVSAIRPEQADSNPIATTRKTADRIAGDVMRNCRTNYGRANSGRARSRHSCQTSVGRQRFFSLEG